MTDSNDIIGNQLLISEMDPQFNFTRPWASQRYFFESESLEWVHDPSAVSKSILTKPNDELAKLYGVNWIIYTYRDNSLPDAYQANSFVIFDNGLTYVVNVYD